MAQPDHDRFRERFPAKQYPEFESPDLDDAIDMELAWTYEYAGTLRPALSATRRELASIYLAAHNLTIEKQPSSQTQGPAAVSATQDLVMGGMNTDPLKTTPYGRAYLNVVRETYTTRKADIALARIGLVA